MTRARAKTAPKDNTLTVDIAVAAAWARAVRAPAAVCKRAAAAAYAMAPARRKPSRRSAELAIVLTSDQAVRKLNAVYRSKDKATDVLSFPAWSKDETPPGDAVAVMLGDVIIAYATSARDARGENKRLADHLSHLVVHGVLHLLGYDHEHDREAAIMERLEISILKTLGIGDPYVARPLRKAAAKRARAAV